MTESSRTYTQTFALPWPNVLTVMRQWIREQMAMEGAASRVQINLSLSVSDLQEARSRGCAMQPELNEFRRDVEYECGVKIPLPSARKGLHAHGPHWLQISFWR